MIRSNMRIQDLERATVKLLCKVGLRRVDAQAMAWVYKTMTLRGVGHHDVTGLPRMLSHLEEGMFNARPDIRAVLDRQAVAVLDGDNAPGPLAAYRAMEKAMRKAARYGVSMVSLRNSNHFMGAAGYALLAAERNMLGIAASNTVSCMGTGGSADRAIGNNPFGFAAQTGAGFPILLDICNAYASYGKLQEYRAAGRKIPPDWGLDARGRPTDDPARVMQGGVPQPMAGHKGFGVALLVEILSAVLGGGAITDEVSLSPQGGNGSSQAFLVIDVEHFMTPRRFRSRTKRLVELLKAHRPLDRRHPIALPGERSHRAARTIRREGVDLGQATVDALNEWADKLGVRG